MDEWGSDLEARASDMRKENRWYESTTKKIVGMFAR